MTSRLKKRYNETVRPALIKKFAYKNPMMAPTLRKIVINMGSSQAAKDKTLLEQLKVELAMIAGQKPIVTKAKKAVSNFKLREGQPIGLKVTLRGERMFEFLDRLASVVLPRVRDFRGLSTKCDGRGNYTLGLEDQTVFPEIDLDKTKGVQGMDITFVTSAETDPEGIELLRNMGMPFKGMPVEVVR